MIPFCSLHSARGAIALSSFTFLAAVSMTAGDARAQNLCEIYTVVQGDTLSDIARRAGIEGGYQVIYSANRDVLDSPNILEIGYRLKMPCADGSLPLGNGTANAESAPSVAPVVASGDLPQIRFLTGTDYAPFVDEGLPEQGMLTELVKRSVDIGKPDQEYRVVVINDWSAHLTELLPSGAFDAGFPWFLPDCTKLQNLSPNNAMRCTEFDASEPFFEAVVGFYTLKGSEYEGVTSYEQLFNSRVCRPEAWFTFDFEAERLVEPNITRLAPQTQVECWEALLAGEADVVTFDALPAEADIEMLGIRDKVVEMTDLSGQATMHVFIPKDNPNSKAYLDIMNAGIAQMRSNGEWFSIVSKHLSAAN